MKIQIGPPWPRVLVIFGQLLLLGYNLRDIETLLFHTPFDSGSLIRTSILLLFNIVLALYNVKFAFQDAQKEKEP